MSGLIKVVRKAKPFYSRVDEAAQALPRPKGTGKEFMTELSKQPGVKKAEIEDRKLKELESLPKMTKQEFVKKLEEKPASVPEEKVISDDEALMKAKIKERAEQMMENEAWTMARNQSRNREEANEIFEDLISDWERTQMDEYMQRAADDLSGGDESRTQFRKYTIPGGENYREILLKLPTPYAEGSPLAQEIRQLGYKGDLSDLNASTIRAFGGSQDLENRWMNATGAQTFRGSHWGDDPNVLAHIRVVDRKGPNGERVLHVEEIQSDWHQAGRKKGYATGKEEQNYIDYLNDLQKRVAKSVEKDYLEAGVAPERALELSEKMATKIAEDPRKLANFLGESEKQMELHLARMQARNAVPDAPFKKNWHELAMKRVMDYAAEGGYDKVAITPGKEQANRYNLAKYIKSIQAEPVDDGEGYIMKIVDKDGKVVANHRYEADELPDHVGKEMADRIISSGGGKFEGLDLQVGGEGMTGFYDQIIPSYINKEYGKYGVRVGQERLPTTPMMVKGDDDLITYTPDSFDVHSIDITPELRESIKTKGQPLYQAIGAGTAGAAAMPEEQTEFRRGGRVHISNNPDSMMLELASRRK